MTSSRTAQKLPGIESNAKFPHIQDFPKALRTWWRLLGGGGWGAENGVLKIYIKSLKIPVKELIS